MWWFEVYPKKEGDAMMSGSIDRETLIHTKQEHHRQ